MSKYRLPPKLDPSFEEFSSDDGNSDGFVFNFDPHHVAICKYLDSVRSEECDLSLILGNATFALSDCYCSESLEGGDYTPYTMIGRARINPIYCTKSAEYPKWIKTSSNMSGSIFLPDFEGSRLELAFIKEIGGYKDIKEVMEHVLRFIVLIYKQKCSGTPIYFHHQIDDEEEVADVKELGFGDYEPGDILKVNIFDSFVFPFRFVH